MGHPALLVLGILCGRNQSLETLFRKSQESFGPVLRGFHLLLLGEVLLTCTPLFRVKVRRPSLFSLSFQQLPLGLKASLPNPHDNSFYVHVYNCTLVNPGAHCVKRGQVRSVWLCASVEGSLAR